MKHNNPYHLIPTLSLSDSYKGSTVTSKLPLKSFLTFSQFLFSYSSMPFSIPTSIMVDIFAEATGGYVSKAIRKVDVISKDNSTAFQVKTRVGLKNDLVWGRMTLRNKLQMIPASNVDKNIRNGLGNLLVDAIHSEFDAIFSTFERFIYVQVMKEKDSHLLVLFSEICKDKLLDFLLSPFEWKWSKTPDDPDQYPSLNAYLEDKKVFSWHGLSGNHFRINDLAYFLSEVSKSSVCIKLPSSIKTLTHEQVVEKLR